MRRKDERGVSPVIATILMVAITVVLAAVLYVMVITILRPVETRPSVVLSNLSCNQDRCDGRVTTVSQPTDLSLFKVTVTADGEPAIAPTMLAAGSNITGGGLTFRYTDVGGEGRMTGGDSFRLSGIQAGVDYEVIFLWRDGSVVQSITFPA